MERMRTSESPAHEGGDSGINPLELFRLFRSAGSALFAQAALHTQLAQVEWAEEKNRLSQMLALTLTGFACLLCMMIFCGVLVLALSWDTDYRIYAVLGIIGAYGLGIFWVWRRFKILAACSGQAFAATRAEIAADIELLRSKL